MGIWMFNRLVDSGRIIWPCEIRDFFFLLKGNHLIRSRDGGEISPSERLKSFQTRGFNTPHLKRLASCCFAINNMFAD